MSLVFAIIISFLIGSIPTGYLIARMRGVDLRKVGSGNTGATNAGRILGKSAGIATLVIDLLKGIVGLEAGLYFMSFSGATSPELKIDPAALLALAAVCGHCFSPWLQFKGGKGVATGGGLFLLLAPLQALIGIVCFAACFKFTKIVSLSSCVAAIVIPLLISFTDASPEMKLAAVAISALVIYRHKENLARLRAGTEKQFSLKG